jgi:hypothetical protein
VNDLLALKTSKSAIYTEIAKLLGRNSRSQVLIGLGGCLGDPNIADLHFAAR